MSLTLDFIYVYFNGIKLLATLFNLCHIQPKNINDIILDTSVPVIHSLLVLLYRVE